MTDQAPALVQTSYTGGGAATTVEDVESRTTLGAGWRFPTGSGDTLDPPNAAADVDAYVLPYVPDTDPVWDVTDRVSVPVDGDTPVVVPAPVEGETLPGDSTEWIDTRDGAAPTVETVGPGAERSVGPDGVGAEGPITVASLGEGRRVPGAFRSRPVLVSTEDQDKPVALVAGPGGVSECTAETASDADGPGVAVVDNFLDHQLDFGPDAVHVVANDSPGTADPPTGYRGQSGFDPDIKNAVGAAADAGVEGITAGSVAGNTVHEVGSSGVRGFTELPQSSDELVTLVEALGEAPHAIPSTFPARAHGLQLAAPADERGSPSVPQDSDAEFDAVRDRAGLRIAAAGVGPPSVDGPAYDTTSLATRIAAGLRDRLGSSPALGGQSDLGDQRG